VRITEGAQPRPQPALGVAAESIGEELDRLRRLAVVPTPREGFEVAEEPLGAPRLVPETTAPPPLVGIEPPHALSYEVSAEFFPERAAGRHTTRSTRSHFTGARRTT